MYGHNATTGSLWAVPPPHVKRNVRLQHSCVLCEYCVPYSYSTILYSTETGSKNKVALYVSHSSRNLTDAFKYMTQQKTDKLSASIRDRKFFTALATICASRRSSIGQILHKPDLQSNTIWTLQYTHYFANKTRSSYSENFWGPTATHLIFQVDASGALTDKWVPQRTRLLVPRTNLQPKCFKYFRLLWARSRHLRTKFSRYSWQTLTYVSTFLQPREGTICRRWCLLFSTNKPHTASRCWSQLSANTTLTRATDVLVYKQQ